MNISRLKIMILIGFDGNKSEHSFLLDVAQRERVYDFLAVFYEHRVSKLTVDCLLFQYMLTHGTKRAEIDFMMLLTIFEHAESNAEWCQAQLFMQRLEFYDLKSASKIARKSLRNKDFSQYKAYVCLLYM